MLGHRELSIDDYVTILRRRWWVILVPAVLGPAIAYGISLGLASRYTSQTLVLVEGQKDPDSFVKPVITEDLNSRLGTMQEQIFSRSRLQPIIERFGLFKEEAAQKPMEELVDRMRKDLRLTPVRSVVTTKDLPGFYIGFTAGNARVAQQVCAEITSMFIQENLRQREQSAQGTTTFLEGQLEEAKRNLDAQEAKLAQFQRKYMGSLPDETQTNFNLLNSLNGQLEAVTQSVNRAQQDKAYTESILAQQTGAWESLKQGNNPHPEAINQQLSAMENLLVSMQARYTAAHPEVIKLKAAIAEFKKKAHETTVAAKETPAQKDQETSLPEPPSIQQLRSQIHMFDVTIRANTREQERLQKQIGLYQSRLQLSPVVEQEYRQVTRDHQTALDFYSELLRKKNQSEMATDLERQQQGEQFAVLDPANLPEKPSFPNRPMFAGAGFGGGLALGLALVLLLEMRDKSMRTERDIEFYLQLPTLAMVPSVGNAKRRKGRGWAKKRSARPDPPVAVVDHV